MTSCLRTPLEVNSHEISDSTKESPTSTEVGIFGTGLQNEVGEYNCFLNVIIQVTSILKNCFDFSDFSGINVYSIQLERFILLMLFYFDLSLYGIWGCFGLSSCVVQC